MKTFSYCEKDIKKLIPKRSQNSNKGSCGRLLVIGGSRGMCGAPYFCAKAAYRMGTGLVEIFTCDANRIPLQALIPEAVMTMYDEDDIDFSKLARSIRKADAVAVGMGLSQSEDALAILKFTLENCTSPILIDADALNLISKNSELWSKIKAPAVITPHPLEMSRLSDKAVRNITGDIPLFAQNFADGYGVITVLKNHNTAVANPHGTEIYINQSGNSGMSTAGSGDVLDGVIGALLASGLNPYNAACLGVYIHGLAGDIASERLSEYSVMASDIADCISNVLLKI